MKKTPEGAWKAAIIDYLSFQYPSCWILPVRGGIGQRPGIPDLLVVIHGKLLGIEAKDPQRPTRLSCRQSEEIAAIRAAGGVAGRVASWEELEMLLEELKFQPPPDPKAGRHVCRSGCTENGKMKQHDDD